MLQKNIPFVRFNKKSPDAVLLKKKKFSKGHWVFVLFCFWFIPNGFQKYRPLIFIGSSRSSDKFDGQLSYRSEPGPGRCGARLLV
jgi:hypothetical protein